MSFKAGLVALVLACGALTTPLSAQLPEGTLERLEGVMALAQQAMNPAAIALTHREALALTGQQVAALEKLSAELQPTIASFTTLSTATPPLSAATSGDTVDREAIRAAYVQQAEKQADVVATLAEAGKQVEAILTPEQRESMERVQREAMLEMMRSTGLIPNP